MQDVAYGLRSCLEIRAISPFLDIWRSSVSRLLVPQMHRDDASVMSSTVDHLQANNDIMPKTTLSSKHGTIMASSMPSKACSTVFWVVITHTFSSV